jgi:hypothetical protein
MVAKPVIHMRVLADDIQTYLYSSGDPLGALKVVNSCVGSEWKFHLKLSESTSPMLSIQIPSQLSIWELLDGTVPEFHWCSLIEVKKDGVKTTIEPLTGHALHSETVDSNQNEIVLHDFTGRHLNPIWGDFQQIKDYLKTFSWLGVPDKKRNHSHVKWKFISQEETFRSDVLNSQNSLGESMSLQDSDFAIDVYERPGTKDTCILEKKFGDFSNRSEFRPLIDAVKRRGLSGALIVLANGWKYDLGPLGIVRSLDRYDKNIQEFKIQILESESFNPWIEKRKQRKEIGEAARLSLRLDQAKNAPKVHYEEHLIGTVPTSEAGASAILHKLEALNGIPFPKFKTIAWASSDGIDAIADIQFDLNEPVGHLLPIEYEFKFENFLTHQHPHGHVHLVACWFRSDLLSRSEKPWLYTYKDAKFKVLVISEVPGLKIEDRK